MKIFDEIFKKHPLRGSHSPHPQGRGMVLKDFSATKRPPKTAKGRFFGGNLQKNGPLSSEIITYVQRLRLGKTSFLYN
jgi:hypothetical protein